jgi:hypothetical protein
VALVRQKELSALDGTRKIDSSNVTTARISVDCVPFRDNCTRFQIVAWPAGEHDDLKRTRLFGEKGAEPVHPGVVALDELIVKNKSGPQILRKCQPVQR